MRRLIFPCGAYVPLKSWPVDGAHYERDGAIRINVYPGEQPYTDDTRLARAACLDDCPARRRRTVERGWSLDGELDIYVFCRARLHEMADSAWRDVTPPAPPKCPHCIEQRTYIQACARAAKSGSPGPDRRLWRVCPKCGAAGEIAETGCRRCGDE